MYFEKKCVVNIFSFQMAKFKNWKILEIMKAPWKKNQIKNKKRGSGRRKCSAPTKKKVVAVKKEKTSA